MDSPGPSAYGTKNTFGANADLRYKSSGSGVAFSRSLRHFEIESRRLDKLLVPGPGEYTVGTSTLGSQLESHMKNGPRHSFATAERDGASSKQLLSKQHARVLRGTHSPAPGAYETGYAFGEQLSSKQRTLPAYRFGNSDRFLYQKQRARAI